MKKKQIITFAVIILVVAGLISLLVVQAKKPGKYDTFAQCISDSGAKFYGAWWCPHCQATKAMFGKSAKLLPYVECSTPDSKPIQQCTDLGIKGYPTWKFADGSELSGERTMTELAEKTNCAIQ